PAHAHARVDPPTDRGHPPGQGLIVCYRPEGAGSRDGHDCVTQAWIARALARLKGCEYAGDFDPSQRYPGTLYFVPKTTLCPIEQARELGIHGEKDLFGGVAPFPFVATKAITHP